MSHGDDGARVLLEVALQPGDGFGVKVVGRLVEQQQVGFGEQQAAERDPALLATGKVGDFGVSRRQSQGVHRRVQHLVEAPGVDRVDLRLQLRELVGGLVRVVGGQLVEAVEQVLDLADPVLDVSAHIFGFIEMRFLLEHPDRRAFPQAGLALELGVDAGHHPEQG